MTSNNKQWYQRKTEEQIKPLCPASFLSNVPLFMPCTDLDLSLPKNDQLSVTQMGICSEWISLDTLQHIHGLETVTNTKLKPQSQSNYIKSRREAALPLDTQI